MVETGRLIISKRKRPKIHVIFHYCPFCLLRSSTDQANMSSKFETLGGELDEKRKLDLYTVFKIFNVYHFIHKPIIIVFNKLMVSAFIFCILVYMFKC